MLTVEKGNKFSIISVVCKENIPPAIESLHLSMNQVQHIHIMKVASVIEIPTFLVNTYWEISFLSCVCHGELEFNDLHCVLYLSIQTLFYQIRPFLLLF